MTPPFPADEVAKELEASMEAIGSGVDVSNFVQEALRAQ